MSDREAIGAALAAAKLEAARAIGVTITLYHPATAPAASALSLKAVVVDQVLGVEQVKEGYMADTSVIVLDIPVQTGLTKMSTVARQIREGDKIIFENRDHFVQGEIGYSAHGYIYRVRARERKAHTIGIKN